MISFEIIVGKQNTMQSVRKKGGYVYKKYIKRNLLDNPYVIETRINTINNFDYNRYHALVKTEINEKNGIYTYRQKQIDILKTTTIKFKQNYFMELIESLEYFDALGFVHGDLNVKNIKYTAEGFKIIDLEPSLLQIRDGRKQFMITTPYISGIDLKTKKITSRTDKIGVYYFLLKMTGQFTMDEQLKLIAPFRKKNGTPGHPQEIEEMSYREILKKVF